jgi:hypothetical protein
MEFNRILRRQDMYGMADGGEIRSGQTDSIRIRIVQVQPGPEFPVGIFAIDDGEFQTQILTGSGIRGSHLRIRDDSDILARRDRIKSCAGGDFRGIEIQKRHFIFSFL